MTQYAKLGLVKRGLPSKRDPSTQIDEDILDIIEDASSWIDSVYPNISPFPSIWERGFYDIEVTRKANRGDSILYIKNPGLNLDKDVEFMLSTDIRDIPDQRQQIGTGSALGLDYSENPNYTDEQQSFIKLVNDMYTLYKLSAKVNFETEGGEVPDELSISFTPKLQIPIPEGNLVGKSILVGTPPLIRRATTLMARYWALSSGPDTAKADRLSVMKKQAENLVGLSTSYKGSMAKAMKKPHPKIYWSPGRVRIARRG